MIGELTLNSIRAAIYKINIHSKTASNPYKLYCLKNAVINKLLLENKAKRIGLYYRPNPKYSYQKSDVLLQIDSYLFHIPITKED
jgi:YkyB-like protein